MAAGDNEVLTGGFALAPVPDLRCLDVPATPDQLLPLRHRLGTWAAAAGLTSDHIDEVVLAGDEATSNVVCHAYPQGGGTFDLIASYRPDLGTVHVTVRDRGHWRPEPADPGSQAAKAERASLAQPAKAERADLELHGRGLMLIRALAHHATFDRSGDGTTVHMTWLLPETETGQR